MEVMAEANEQPALLNQRLDEDKKNRRPRNAAGARKPSAAKSGARRTRRPSKEPELRSAENNNSSRQDVSSEKEQREPNSQISLPISAPAENVAEPVVSADQSDTSDLNEMAEQPAVQETAPPKLQEPAPAVETPKYEPVFGEGLIEVSGKGFGFLRDPKRNYTQSPQDIFVTPEVVRKHALRDGLWIKGEIRRGSRGPQLFKLTQINGEDPEKYRNLPVFEELTSINPLERIRLETVPDRYTTRVMDLMTPIGKGQRGLIVAPPRTGKTTLLQHIASAVVKNHPEMKLIILLVDERPEEVTEIRRTVPQADIMASSNDSDIKSHTRIAQLAIERAKRLVEAGKDVFVLLDSLTRVGRAFNNAMAGGGRTMSGGMDSRAMEIPRKLFAAARNTEEAGSLTIMATALIETGSKMDELIFQEFKGTGNMEMVLDRQVSDQRIYPAIDIFKSGTRREELLLTVNDLEKINTIRRGLAGHRPPEAIERLLSFLKKFPTNAQMLREIPG
jgi:transcription termination factor Rho